LVFIHTSFDCRVATMSRLLKIIGLFCKRALPKRPIFFKETYNFKEPTNRSHPIQKETCCTKTTWSFHTQDTHFQVGDVSATSVFLVRQLGLFTHKMCVKRPSTDYGVASISRLLKIIGFFCRISSLLLGSFAEESGDTSRVFQNCKGFLPVYG